MDYKKVFLFILIISVSTKGDSYWVKHGWELFQNGGGAPTIALGNAMTAYSGGYVGSYLSNPAHTITDTTSWTFSHQSRFAGMINRELFGIPISYGNRKLNAVFIYEGIGQIPDTRDMLLDWGLDGQFGTHDLGEGNGVLDEGERLDKDKLTFFGQHQFGAYVSTPVTLFGQKGGLGIKALYHSIGEHSGIGIGFHFGIIQPMKKGTLGIAIKDIPSSGILWENGTVEGTLPSMSMGYSYPINIPAKSLKIYLNAGSHLDVYNRHLFSSFGIGNMGFSFDGSLDILYKDKISFQLGRSKDSFISSGIGIQFNSFSLHYAFMLTDLDTQLGNNHYISMRVDPHWILKKLSSSKSAL